MKIKEELTFLEFLCRTDQQFVCWWRCRAKIIPSKFKRGIYTYSWCMFQNGIKWKRKKVLANYITTNLLNGIFITSNSYTFSSKFQWQNTMYDSFYDDLKRLLPILIQFFLHIRCISIKVLLYHLGFGHYFEIYIYKRNYFVYLLHR